MVEGLTTSAPDPGSGTETKSGIRIPTIDEIVDLDFSAPVLEGSSTWTPPITSSSRILVTLAERPYPFPSRTRKSSSPAPKILRGQPFGKIGRRQDLVLSGEFAARAAADRLCCRDDRGRSGHSARRTDARPGHPRRGGGIGAGRLACPPRLPIPHVRGRRLAARHAFARPPL